MKKIFLCLMVMVMGLMSVQAQETRTPIATIEHGQPVFKVSQAILIEAFNQEFDINFENIEIMKSNLDNWMIRLSTKQENDIVYAFPWGLDVIADNNGNEALYLTNNKNSGLSCVCVMTKCFCNPACTNCDPSQPINDGGKCEDKTFSGGVFSFNEKQYQCVHVKHDLTGRVANFY